jgi:peptidoglycan/xylan/chitin deacetylase (PgdA/CDA1 family)
MDSLPVFGVPPPYHHGIPSGLAIILSLLLVGILFFLIFYHWKRSYGLPGLSAIPILTYHKVDERWEWGGTRTTPRQFATQMSWLKEEGYRSIPTSEVARLVTGGKRPLPKSVGITFDDGYESIYQNVFPVMKNLGFVGTVFLVTDYVGKSNSWDVNLGGRKFHHLSWFQIKKMAEAGWEFGSHSASHPDLTKIPEADVLRELQRSKEAIEKELGKPCVLLSYPFGRYDEKVQALAKQAGYQGAFALYPPRPNGKEDLFALRRAGVYLTDTLFDFKVKVEEPAFWFPLSDMSGRLINWFASGTFMVKGYSDRGEKKALPPSDS